MLLRFCAAALQRKRDELALVKSPKQGLTGDVVSFVLDRVTSQRLAALKEFSRDSMFAKEARALRILDAWLCEWKNVSVSVPRVLASVPALIPSDRARGHNLRAGGSEAHGRVMLMELAQGRPIEDLLQKLGASSTSHEGKDLDRDRRNVNDAVVAVAGFFASLHTRPAGSGAAVVSEAYLQQFIDQADNILARMRDSQADYDAELK
mgnify:CR=1 FL=1